MIFLKRPASAKSAKKNSTTLIAVPANDATKKFTIGSTIIRAYAAAVTVLIFMCSKEGNVFIVVRRIQAMCMITKYGIRNRSFLMD
jgi:hypothetical protein